MLNVVSAPDAPSTASRSRSGLDADRRSGPSGHSESFKETIQKEAGQEISGLKTPTPPQETDKSTLVNSRHSKIFGASEGPLAIDSGDLLASDIATNDLDTVTHEIDKNNILTATHELEVDPILSDFRSDADGPAIAIAATVNITDGRDILPSAKQASDRSHPSLLVQTEGLEGVPAADTRLANNAAPQGPLETREVALADIKSPVSAQVSTSDTRISSVSELTSRPQNLAQVQGQEAIAAKPETLTASTIKGHSETLPEAAQLSNTAPPRSDNETRSVGVDSRIETTISEEMSKPIVKGSTGSQIQTQSIQTSSDPAPANTPSHSSVSEAPRTADLATETDDLRTAIKAPAAQPADSIKMMDAIHQSTVTLTAGDMSPSPLKTMSLANVTSPSPLLAGMSDRLATTLFQTATAQPTVTLDKVPQAVVAVALTARSATLQIDPPELGRIQLEYQFDTQGRTVVTLTPESESARLALADRMATITAALEQGSQTDVDVKLGDARHFGSEFGQPSQEGSESESESHSSDRSSAPSSQSPVQTDPAIFVRDGSSGTDRLHILV